MALQNFVDKVGPVVSAAWLNAVDLLKFTIFGDATTKAQARTNLTSDLPMEVVNGGTGTRLGSPSLYIPETSVETAAGATPTQFNYPPYHAERYGFSPGATAIVNAAALQKAINAASHGRVSTVTIESTGQCLVNANDIYFYYDVALNPNFLNIAVVPPVSILGQGYTPKGAFNNGLYTGTVLDFGTQEMTIGNGTLNLRGSRLKNLTLISSNGSRVLRFRKVSHNVGWEDITVFQKGTGGGIEMDDCFYVVTGGETVIYSNNGANTGKGLYIFNSSQAAGQYEIRNVTGDSFAQGRVFGQEPGTTGALMNNLVATNNQSISCGEGLVCSRGLKDAVFICEHLESNVTTGIQVYEGASGLVFISPYLQNSAATNSDVQLGKTGLADADNLWKNIHFINPHFVNVFAIGLNVWYTATCEMLMTQGGSWAAQVNGVGVGIQLNGSTSLHGTTFDQPSFNTATFQLLTNISSTNDVEYYRASDTKGRLTYRGPISTAGIAFKQANVTSATDLPWVDTVNVWRITGATTINTITAPTDGNPVLYLIFVSTPTVNDESTAAGNISLAGNANFAATADDTLTLVWDSTGTKWRQLAVSVN